MVKADCKHNYYADLELPASATVEDVRKAYRKLALQYHPDRNAGREEECVPKFQAIQSAMEVLGEPTSKQRYDAERKRMGINAFGGQTFNPKQPGAGNPYAANTNFPPPPRRTQPGQWARPPPPQTGAERFSYFPKPTPTARTDAAQDTQNRFKAWEKMQSRPPPTQQTRPQPPPFVPPQQAPPQAHYPRPQPPPRQGSRYAPDDPMKPGGRTNKMPPPSAFENGQTAWQSWRGRNHQPGMARTTPRKYGFNPNTPGSDEKPADAHYFHRRPSDDLGRPNPNVDTQTPAGSTPVSPTSPTSRRPNADPTRPFGTRTPNDQAPFTEGSYRKSAPYNSANAAHMRQRVDLADGLRRSFSTHDTTKLDPRDAANQSRARSTSPLRRQRASESYANDQSKKAFDLGYSSTDSSDAETPDAGIPQSDRPSTAPTSGRPRKKPTPPSTRLNGSRNGLSSPPPVPQRQKTGEATDGVQSEGERPNVRQKGNPNIFSFRKDPNLFRPTTAKSRSEENINTTFTSKPWDGAFGEQDFASPPPTGTKDAAANLSTRTPKEHTRAATMDLPNTTTAGDMPQRFWGSDGRSKDSAPSGASANTSSQEQPNNLNQEQFQNPFDWQPPQRSGSPTKGGAGGQGRKQVQGRKMSKAANRGATSAKAAQQPQTLDEDDTIEAEGTDGSPEHGAPVMDEPEPMDIDNTPPAQTEARIYNVPRSRRQEQEQKQVNAQQSHNSSGAARKPVPTATLKTSLDDLRNVAPFGKPDGSSGGAFNLESVSATLPHQSHAASNIIKPNKLGLPLMPKAPDQPSRLTTTSWPEYVQKFTAYVNAFHIFNQKLIQHFAAREQLVGLNFHNPSKWLQAAGDTSGLSGAPTGFETYLAMIQEDVNVREHWNLGCDRHEEAVKNFGKVRERVRKLAEGGGLASN